VRILSLAFCGLVLSVSISGCGGGGTGGDGGNGGGGGGQQSTVPVLSSLSQGSATAGGTGFTLQVKGSNFVTSSVIDWNGAALTTTYTDAFDLSAQVPAADIAAGAVFQSRW